MELVRTFRTYYDHFRIAFPHLSTIPKHYDPNWGDEFRVLSRDFVRNEDMNAVKHVFDCAGYGTDRWDKLTSLNIEDLTGRFDQIITLNGFAKNEANGKVLEPPESAPNQLANAKRVIGSDLWNLLLESPETFVELLNEPAPTDSDSAEAPAGETAVVEVPNDRAASTNDLEQPEIEVVGPDPALAQLIEVVGAETWTEILADPSILVDALQSKASTDPVEVEAETTPTEPTADSEPDSAIDEHLRALDAVRGEKKELESQLEKLREELSEVIKASEKLAQQFEDRGREQGAMAKKLASVEEKLKDAEAKAAKLSKLPEKSAIIAPTKAAQQIQEFEASLQRAQEELGELQSKSETDDLRIKEIMGDLKREQFLRQKFEDDLEETRTALTEQIQRLRAVLQNEEEIPAIDELEDMSGDELMEYIGDVEKEKQRVMAGLDALDTQEEGYQKQIEAQNEQLGAIQEDMGKLKESTLAMEVEELQETLEKQKSQLQMLMGYSRNLKSRNEQMAERQEPLRNLVQKLNLQEKALVRFIRINYDGKFMPENAYL